MQVPWLALLHRPGVGFEERWLILGYHERQYGLVFVVKRLRIHAKNVVLILGSGHLAGSDITLEVAN